MLPECRLDRVHDINLTRAVGCELVLAGEMRSIPSGSVIVVEVDEIWTPRARHHLPFFAVPFPSRAASPARPAPWSTERHPTAPSFQPTVHPWTTESLLAGGRGISARSFACWWSAHFHISSFSKVLLMTLHADVVLVLSSLSLSCVFFSLSSNLPLSRVRLNFSLLFSICLQIY